MNLNQANLIGRVTRDPELKSTSSGTAVASFSIATNHVYKNQTTGEKVENVSFHNCVIFGRGAEVFSQYVVKGQEVYVSGRIQYQEWEKKDGSKGYRTDILVENFQFGQKPKGAEQTSYQQNSPEAVEPDDGEIKVEDVAF